MKRRSFWQGETYAIVKAMKAFGNQPGVVQRWKGSVEKWAQRNAKAPEAQTVLAWLPHWKVRPFYTTIELAPMWPALAIAIGFTKEWPKVQKSPARLAHELDYAGLPKFDLHGKTYYIVERLHYWKAATEKEREDALA